MSGLEGDRWKRAEIGTSLAVYPTSRPDLWGTGGEIPPVYPAQPVTRIGRRTAFENGPAADAQVCIVVQTPGSTVYKLVAR